MHFQVRVRTQITMEQEKAKEQEVRFFILQQPGRIEYNDHALSMKYSICNIQLLPKAADLRKKTFDEFRLKMLIVLL